jgi:SAM-dependent MidA family methyltransferase
MAQSPPLVPEGDATSLTASPAAALLSLIIQTIQEEGGWIPFDRYMGLALYTPALGYYSSTRQKFGTMPASGSDFVTAPELSPLFGYAFARQVHQALVATQTDAIWEFGAGTGALALQVLEALDELAPVGAGEASTFYHIVELSGNLKALQQHTLARFGHRVRWHDSLPATLTGVVLGNEVLDAMPVHIVARKAGRWCARGVGQQGGQLVWADRPLAALDTRPYQDFLSTLQSIEGQYDYQTELPTHAVAFITTLAERLTRGAAFFVDYGFPAHEFYHAERSMGTLVCHYRHQVDPNPLDQPGEKDITAHVDFTAMALAWQAVGDAIGQPDARGTLGYCSQGRFLLNCGLGEALAKASPQEQSAALRLLHEHEMGELFKVLGLYVGPPWEAMGFASGDRSHTL